MAWFPELLSSPFFLLSLQNAPHMCRPRCPDHVSLGPCTPLLPMHVHVVHAVPALEPQHLPSATSTPPRNLPPLAVRDGLSPPLNNPLGLSFLHLLCSTVSVGRAGARRALQPLSGVRPSTRDSLASPPPVITPQSPVMCQPAYRSAYMRRRECSRPVMRACVHPAYLPFVPALSCGLSLPPAQQANAPLPLHP